MTVRYRTADVDAETDVLAGLMQLPEAYFPIVCPVIDGAPVALAPAHFSDHANAGLYSLLFAGVFMVDLERPGLCLLPRLCRRFDWYAPMGGVAWLIALMERGVDQDRAVAAAQRVHALAFRRLRRMIDNARPARVTEGPSAPAWRRAEALALAMGFSMEGR